MDRGIAQALLRITFLSALVLTGLFQNQASAQTMVIGKPVSDQNGMIAFQIIDILKVEGEWDPPLELGEVLYPRRPQKAHPIMRFGESVLIALTEPNKRNEWQGLHVHNGCIPAMQGKPLDDMVHEILVQAEEEQKAEAARIAAGGKPKSGQKPAVDAQFAVCPICHQRHIRIR